MIKRIEKSEADGIINAPTSKSAAHRLLICASMCKGRSRIDNLPLCEDVLATIDCLRELGVSIELDGKSATVHGIDFTKAEPTNPLNCRESGSTLRFLIPIAMLSGKEVRFTGSEKLLSRPMTVYENLAKEYQLSFKKNDGIISVCGPLTAGEYCINGGVSSQFITGMLLALSQLNANSKIIVKGQIESRPYVDLTMSIMAKMGVSVYQNTESSFLISGGQEYQAKKLSVEGDWSNAAFLGALDLFSRGGYVSINLLDENSAQGDKLYRKYFAMLEQGYAEIDITSCPDLGPILFTVAAAKQGGKFIGTKRLKDKESDRIAAMEQELSKFGAELIIEENSVIVKNTTLHAPSERLYGHNDHRVVMSLAVLCTIFGGEIDGCEAVNKSYPDFFRDIKILGINHYEIN